MENRATDSDRMFERVSDSAEALSDLLDTAHNFPIEDYVGASEVRALASALTFERDSWSLEDLDAILVVRDGFYRIRSEVADKSEQGEHSIDLLLNALNRLYVDLERAIRSVDEQALARATREVSTLRSGRAASAFDNADLAAEVGREALKVAVSSFETQRSMQVHITNNVNILSPTVNVNVNAVVEAFRSMRINIRRLSATAFSVSLSLLDGPVFQGIFRFLHDTADKSLEELRSMLKALKGGYDDLKGIITDVEKLADTGNRFVKLVAKFMKAVFGDESLSEPDVEMRVRSYSKGPTILCALGLQRGQILLGGKDGLLSTVDPATAMVGNPRIVDERPHINAAAELPNGQVAFGTEEGLVVGRALEAFRPVRANYREKVVAVTVMPWGGLRSAIVTGSVRGDLRRWTLTGNLSRSTDIKRSRDGANRLGRTITGLLPWNELLVAATDSNIFYLREDFEAERNDLTVGFEIRAMTRLDRDTLIVVGQGNIASVQFDSGYITRLITTSSQVTYLAVARMSKRVFIVADDKGRIIAFDVNSGAELGVVQVDILVRGLHITGNTILAYGGGWNSREGASVASIVWSRGELHLSQ